MITCQSARRRKGHETKRSLSLSLVPTNNTHTQHTQHTYTQHTHSHRIYAQCVITWEFLGSFNVDDAGTTKGVQQYVPCVDIRRSHHAKRLLHRQGRGPERNAVANVGVVVGVVVGFGPCVCQLASYPDPISIGIGQDMHVKLWDTKQTKERERGKEREGEAVYIQKKKIIISYPERGATDTYDKGQGTRAKD